MLGVGLGNPLQAQVRVSRRMANDDVTNLAHAAARIGRLAR